VADLDQNGRPISVGTGGRFESEPVADFSGITTQAWPRIRESKEKGLSSLEDREKQLIALAANAVEAFVNFGCIATGILQILALNHEHRIWQNYKGWLRTISSAIPSEEIVKSVIQEEFFHNFHSFSNSAIYRIIMSKRKKIQYNDLPEAA
jgi:hypothetical protein